MAPFKTPKVTSQANKIKKTSHCKKQKHTANSVHIQVKCNRDSIIHIIKNLSKKICFKTCFKSQQAIAIANIEGKGIP